MISQQLPRVLQGAGGESSISMERSLKQILLLLEMMDIDCPDDEVQVDASIADVKMMLRHLI